jgi:protein SCO1
MGTGMSMTSWRGIGAAVAALVAALLLPAYSCAHLESGAGEHQAGTSRPAQQGAVQVGVAERLGSRIPLDIPFRDENGGRVRLADIVTGPTIIVPVYYRCSNVCSSLQGDLARVLPALPGAPGADYRVISFSIDETEPPDLAARAKRTYLSAIGAPFPASGWRFLTGDAASIRRLTDAAGFTFQRRGVEFMHPVVSFVVSGDGLIVRYLYGTSFLPKDVTLALIEAGEGRVGTTIRKVVGFCFSFDAEKKSYQLNLLRICGSVVLVVCGGFFLFLVLTGKKRKPHVSGGS